MQTAAAPWFAAAVDAGIEVSRRVLGEVGLTLPVLAPAQGFLLHLTRR